MADTHSYQVLVLVDNDKGWVTLTDPFLTYVEAVTIAYRLRLPYKVMQRSDDGMFTEVEVRFW